jgi:hypothetical protein
MDLEILALEQAFGLKFKICCIAGAVHIDLEECGSPDGYQYLEQLIRMFNILSDRLPKLVGAELH